MVNYTNIPKEVGEAALELVGILENFQIHHGRARWLSKEDQYDIWKGVYELASALIQRTPDKGS